MSDQDLVGAGSSDLVNPDATPEPDKPTTAKTTAKRQPARGRGKAAQLEDIKPSLTAGWVMVGGSISMVLPLTGKTMIYQAEELTDSLVLWGKSSPRIAKILLTAGKTGGAFAFLTAAAPAAIALMVELKTINPEMGKNLLPEELHQFIPQPEPEWNGHPGSPEAAAPSSNGGEGHTVFP